MTDRPVTSVVVTDQDDRRTLADFLRRWQGGLSWSQARRLVASRRVHVSGSLCLDPARRLEAGESIEIEAEPAPRPVTSPAALVIRHVDSQVVVVEKPAGLLSVRRSNERGWPRRRKELAPALEELLAARVAQGGRRRGRDRPPLFVVQRLDRETSGLLVFARTESAQEALKQQFRSHTVHRKYLAVITGRVAPQTIRSQLVRDRGDGLRGSTSVPGQGKRAVTHVQPIEDLGPYQLIECRLETGRTNQIRIHLSELGCPVCGERRYDHPLLGPRFSDTSQAPRLALHAAELGFQHPTHGVRMEFQMPLPPDLAVFIERLRSLGPADPIQDEG